MIYSISQRRLVARYLLLYCLFGVVVGVQLSSGNWVVEVFNYWPITGGHLLMAFTMSGLLLGELCGARVTQRYSSSTAVLFAAVAFATSAVVSLLAVSFWSTGTEASVNSELLLAAAFTCGIGLGTQHSSLDAWFSVCTRYASGRSPTDSEMGWGYTTYTLGFFLGQVLFFPLMYHGWDLDIATVVDHQSQPLTKPIFASPFMLALGAAVLVLIFRPYALGERDPEASTEKGQSSHNTAEIFRRGGIPFITMLLVGSCVSFVIFHIDTFAGPDLLPGSTVKEKTLGLGILCFATFVMVGIFSWRLDADKRFRTLSPAARSGVLACNLAITVLLLGLIVLKGSALGWLGVAVVLGVSSGFVNMLPQVVKWAILDSAAIEDKAKASAILGIAKRVPNLIFSVTIVSFEAAKLDTPDFAYKLLIGAILVAIAGLAIYYSRVQRYSFTIDYPSDKQLSIDGVLAASISDVPNTMLEDAQHLAATKGKARLNLSIYSTSRDYVSQLLRTLRHQEAVSRVAIKRSGKLS